MVTLRHQPAIVSYPAGSVPAEVRGAVSLGTGCDKGVSIRHPLGEVGMARRRWSVRSTLWLVFAAIVLAGVAVGLLQRWSG